MQILIDNCLGSETNLIVGLLKLQSAKGGRLVNQTCKEQLNRIENLVVRNAAHDKIVFLRPLASPAGNDKIQPFFIVCVKFEYPPGFQSRFFQLIPGDNRRTSPELKAFTPAHGLRPQRRYIESWAEIHPFSGMCNVRQRNFPIGTVINDHAKTPLSRITCLISSMM